MRPPKVIREFRFEEQIDSFLFETGEEGLTPEEREIRRKEADGCDLKFAKIYFPNIFNEPWNSLHRHIAGLKQGRFTVSGARRFGKSAFTYVAKVIKPLAIGGPGIINISLRTQREARERSAALVRLLKRNKKLAFDYGLDISQNLKGHYIINGKHLVATSVQTGLRSILDDEFKRFSVSINDDLYHKDSVKSQKDNRKVYDFITSEVYGQLEEHGLSVTLGNSISENCPIRLLSEEFPEYHFSLPATDEEGRTNWLGHSVFTSGYWTEKQKQIPLDIWLGEYMDAPSVKGDVFDPDWIRFGDPGSYDIITALTAIDPSSGKSPSACEKGIVTIGLTREGEVIVLDIYLRQEDYPMVFDYVDALRNKIPAWKTLLFENDFNQWELAAPWYNSWRLEKGKVLPVQRYSAKDLKTQHRGSDKESRILNLVYPHQTGSIIYSDRLKGSADFQKFKSQYISFGGGRDKLDGLDALAAAYIMAHRYSESRAFKPLKQRFGNNNIF